MSSKSSQPLFSSNNISMHNWLPGFFTSSGDVLVFLISFSIQQSLNLPRDP
jgi:hypothetical protein